MKKPLHSADAAARAIQTLEASILQKEHDLRGQRDEQAEFRKYIELHKMYLKDPTSMNKPPPYNLSALEDGVRQIRMNIRKIEEIMQSENAKLRDFYKIMAACKAYDSWAEAHPKEASGVIEISAEEAENDPDFMKIGG